jgi:hypothetical protein
LHIRDVINSPLLAGMMDFLTVTRRKVVLIIATDGESSDGDLAVAMAPLAHLPVHVVVRLCTNDSKVVSYWDAIDKRLGM